jgi:NADH-quinone oxidoreductase subunit G
MEPKRVFGRDDFGGDILFYGDRCVMCTRCVRFMEEKAQDPRLTVVERGNRSVIDTFFEEGLTGSPYAGNIVDICPVGALVSKDFLHKARAWDLDHTPSICPGCSQGCNIDLHTRDNLVQRLKPRENLEVNEHWMCDYGRHRYEWMNRSDRIETPLLAMAAGLRPTHWNEAVDQLVAALSGGAGPVKAVASPHASNEDLAALASLVETLGGGEILFRSPEADEEIPMPGFSPLARRRDLSPNRNGAELLGMKRVGDSSARGGLDGIAGHTGALIVLGDELADLPDTFGESARLYLYLGSYPTKAASAADVVLPITTFAEQEGSFTNRDRRVQRFWPGLQAPGDARPAWSVLRAIVEALGGADAPGLPADAFAAAASAAPAFRGMSYDSVGTKGALSTTSGGEGR